MQGQMELFATDTPQATPAPPVRTWADVRTGERVTYNVPGSPWCGIWTVRRIERHPHAGYALIVTLVDDDGRTWVSVPHRDADADVDVTA
ncbi:hypothetical protein [Polymorphospora rubra]|uniref:Uncharacterized protein n=1 Tax=Polymorphospora rubra TaxID=338584 RepID=A0A810MVW6_9ACTN|nr:hypothetical protein [Polymorphospora rubra]BCJ64129.1 hypothetical protein Prubr_11500 [Polymorphospora rubra]